MTDETGYAVGRGRPPRHTRFQKGLSGNPGGKPSAAKAVRAQLHEAIEKALATRHAKLETTRRRTTLEDIADRLVLDAADGDTAQSRLLLALLEEAEGTSKRNATGASAKAKLSLSEGKSQGKISGAFQKSLKLLGFQSADGKLLREGEPDPRENAG